MKVALAGTESLTNYIAALKANDIEVINTLDVEEAFAGRRRYGSEILWRRDERLR